MPPVLRENLVARRNPGHSGRGWIASPACTRSSFSSLSELRDTPRSRAALQLELFALRHQLATMKWKSPRPLPRPLDRLVWVLLFRLLPNWRDVLVIVTPETVIGWHPLISSSCLRPRSGFSSCSSCCITSAGGLCISASRRTRLQHGWVSRSQKPSRGTLRHAT